MLAGLLLAAALMGQPATTTDTNPAAATKPRAAETKPDEPKKICVLQAQTGSHFKKRICATAEEWEERRRRDAEEIAKMSDRQGFCRSDNC